jgi:hypothetical protein
MRWKSQQRETKLWVVTDHWKGIKIMTEIIKKKICSDCGLEKKETEYYLSRNNNSSTMDICKDCFKKEFYNSTEIYAFFRKYDLPFFIDIMDNIIEKYKPDSVLGEYMKTINSLSQYRNLTWKDSILEYETNKKDDSFYDSIVDNLKKEADKLSGRLNKLSESQNISNDYIATIKSLKETLDLINKYDWRLMYSEYGVIENGEEIPQVSIWEQNHDNQIRNYKFWNVIKKISTDTKEYGMSIGNSLNKAGNLIISKDNYVDNDINMKL